MNLDTLLENKDINWLLKKQWEVEEEIKQCWFALNIRRSMWVLDTETESMITQRIELHQNILKVVNWYIDAVNTMIL